MTKQQLLEKITDNGWIFLQEKNTGVEGTLSHFAVAVYKKDGDAIIRQWFPYYLENDIAYWQDSDPFKIKEVSVITKEQQLESLETEAKKISGLIEIGLESQASLDIIITEYTSLKLAK